MTKFTDKELESVLSNFDKSSFSLKSKNSFRGKTTLDTLENDNEFSSTAERFLTSIGEDDDTVESLYEYMRDADYNLASGAYRAFQELPNFSDQQKKDYKYLRTKFENADTGGLKQWMRATADIGIDVATDPTMILSALMVPFTGGLSMGGRVAAGEATKMGLKRIGKSLTKEIPVTPMGLTRTGKSFTQTVPLTKIMRDSNLLNIKGGTSKAKAARLKEIKAHFGADVKQTALIGASEGAVFSGVAEYLKQEQDDVDGINLRYGLDVFDIGASTVLGAVAGGALAGGITKVSQKMDSEVRRTIEKFSDERLLDESDGAYRAARAAEYAISATIGKPTTRFKTLSNSSPTLAALLTRFRYDTFKEGGGSGFLGTGYNEKLLEQARAGVTSSNTSYNQQLNNRTGKYIGKYEDAIRPLLKKEKLSDEDNILLDSLMRNKDLEKLLKDPIRKDDEAPAAFTKRFKATRAAQNKKALNIYGDQGVTLNHINTIRESRKLTDSALEESKSVGLYTRKLFKGPNAWFARRWKKSVIEENRNELAEIMIEQNAVSLSDDIVLQYLPKDQQKQYKELMQYTNLYEDLLVNFKRLPTSEVKLRIDALDVKFRPEEKRMDGTPEALIDMLHEIQQRKYDLSNTLPDNSTIKAEKFRVANDIIDTMVDKRNLVNDVDSEFSTTMTPSSFSSRNLYMLDDSTISKFIDNDYNTLMRDYLTDTSRAMTRKELFGINTEEFSRNYLDKIRDELQNAGGTLKENDRADLVDMFEYATGLKNTTFESGKGQTASDYAKLSQQMAHLPLATFSSLTEAFIPLTRVSTGTYLKGIGQAIKSWSKTNQKNTMDILQSEHGLTKEEANREMHRVYLGLEQSVAQRIDSIAGEGLQGSIAKKIQTAFFKVNLLSQWTRTVQLASFTMGKDLITKNLRTVAEFQGTKLSGGQKKKLNRATQELYDLGVNIPQGVSWVKNGAKRYSGRKNRNTNIQEWNSFYEQQVMQGASRFANEIILDPSKAAVTRPHVQTSATGSILFQFLGYPTAFSNTVLKNYYTQIKRDPLVGTAKVGSTALFMTGVATGLNGLRTAGESFEKDPDEIIVDSISRWGGLGFGEYIRNAKTNAEVGGGTLGTLAKSVTGPIVGDAVDAILYRKGPTELAATNLPFYSMIPSKFRKEYVKKPAQEIDYTAGVMAGLRKPRQEPSLYSEFAKPYKDFKKAYDRDRNFAGGLIDRFIERTGENPSARVDKTTGTSYEEQAGAILQNRKTFRLGGFIRKGIQSYMSKSGKPVTLAELEADPMYQELAPMLRNMETVDEAAVLKDVNSGFDMQLTPEEQNYYTSSFVENSVEAKDVYAVIGEEADTGLYGSRMGSYAPKYKESERAPNVGMSKNKIRIRQPLKLEEEMPDIPFYLIYNSKFISRMKNSKKFEALKKDITKKLDIVQNIDDSNSLFDKQIIADEVLTSGNKQLYKLLNEEGYDSIEFNGSEIFKPNLTKSTISQNPSTFKVPLVKTVTGKETTPKLQAVLNANEAGGMSSYLKQLEAEGLKDPREADTSYSIIEDGDPENAIPEQLVDMEIPTEDLLGSQVDKILATTEGSSIKQYLIFNQEQILPFGLTETPTKQELKFVNESSVEDRLGFLAENDVERIGVEPRDILKTIERDGVFNLISTATKDSFGSVISYKELTPELLEDLVNNNSLKADSAQLSSLKNTLNAARIKQQQGFEVMQKGKKIRQKYIVSEQFYVELEIIPGQESLNVSNALTTKELITSVKTSNKFLYHPEDNNILTNKARKFRLLNIDADDLQQPLEEYPSQEVSVLRSLTLNQTLKSFDDNIQEISEQIVPKKNKKTGELLKQGLTDKEYKLLLSKSEKERFKPFNRTKTIDKSKGTQYKGRYDKSLDQQLEEVEDVEFFNPDLGEEPTDVSEASVVEKANYENRFSKGVTSKQRFSLEAGERFKKENPEFDDPDYVPEELEILEDNSFTAQNLETYEDIVDPKDKIILPSLIPKEKQVEIKPFVYDDKGTKAWAFYSQKDDVIYIDDKELEKRYALKAWLTPKKEGVNPLPKNAINSLEDWRSFIHAHERSHTINKRRENEDLPQYENRTNKIALADLIYQKEINKRKQKFKGGKVLKALKRKVNNV